MLKDSPDIQRISPSLAESPAPNAWNRFGKNRFTRHPLASAAQLPYPYNSMWYVNKLFDQPRIETLSSKGFLVRNSGGVVRIEKYNCGAELRKGKEGSFQMTEIPCIMLQGQFTTPLGRGLSEVSDHPRGKKVSRQRQTASGTPQVQRRATHRARRAHLLQRSPRLHVSLQCL